MSAIPWILENQRFLALEVERLRLVCARRVRWVRSRPRAGTAETLTFQVVHDAVADQALEPEDRTAERAFYDAVTEALKKAK